MGSLKRDREGGLGHLFLLSFLSFFSNFLLVMSNLFFVILSLWTLLVISFRISRKISRKKPAWSLNFAWENSPLLPNLLWIIRRCHTKNPPKTKGYSGLRMSRLVREPGDGWWLLDGWVMKDDLPLIWLFIRPFFQENLTIPLGGWAENGLGLWAMRSSWGRRVQYREVDRHHSLLRHGGFSWTWLRTFFDPMCIFVGYSNAVWFGYVLWGNLGDIW